MADDFSFTITKHIGEISKSKSGWTLELNMVSWGGRDAKFDIRSWAPDHQKMGYADGGRIDFIKRAFEYRFLLKNINTVFLYPFSNLKHLPAVQTVRWFASAAELPAGCRRQPNYPADAEQQGSCFLYFFVL